MPEQGQERDVAVGQRTIRLHEFGSGPAVLMLHGGVTQTKQPPANPARFTLQGALLRCRS